MKWDSEKEKLNNLINVEHLSYVSIGKIYGCCANNIKKQAKKLGITLPKKREINKIETFNKGVKLKEQNPNTICPVCGGYKFYSSKLCSKCRNESKKHSIREKELGYFIGYGENRETHLTGKCTEIRKDARKFMENESSQEKVCFFCKNHEFDDILEVHHVKGILSFPDDEKIKNINCDENLRWLCPNHHAMVEKGIIKLEY